MAYPGDFVAANRTARTDAQRAAIRLLRKERRMSGLRRTCFRVWEWLIKCTPGRIYSLGSYGFHSR